MQRYKYSNKMILVLWFVGIVVLVMFFFLFTVLSFCLLYTRVNIFFFLRSFLCGVFISF